MSTWTCPHDLLLHVLSNPDNMHAFLNIKTKKSRSYKIYWINPKVLIMYSIFLSTFPLSTILLSTLLYPWFSKKKNLTTFSVSMFFVSMFFFSYPHESLFTWLHVHNSMYSFVSMSHLVNMSPCPKSFFFVRFWLHESISTFYGIKTEKFVHILISMSTFFYVQTFLI